MARPLRIEYPGAFYHVINRGNAGQVIFKSKRDREKFKFYLARITELFSVRIHTYCLMTNHYHLLIETPEPNLSKSIQWLNVSYAMYFNTKRNRRGHLFQGRFKSILVEADEYLKHLSRYIHLNPLRAKMVDAIEDYQWSSYPAFIGSAQPPDWLETDWILKLFGSNRRAAQKKYKGFVEAIDLKYLENPSDDLVGGLILGGEEFVEWVKDTYLRGKPDNREVTGLSELKPREPLEAIIEKVSEYYQCDIDQVLRKGRKRNLSRDVAIYLARETTGLSTVALGQHFGGVCGASITQRHAHIKGRLPEERAIRKVVAIILKTK